MTLTSEPLLELAPTGLGGSQYKLSGPGGPEADHGPVNTAYQYQFHITIFSLSVFAGKTVVTLNSCEPNTHR